MNFSCLIASTDIQYTVLKYQKFIAFIEKSYSSTKGISSTTKSYFDTNIIGFKPFISRGELDKYNVELILFRNELNAPKLKTLSD